MTSDARLLYMTAATSEEASAICETLVSERLVACANILGPMTSIYRWQDAVQRDDEVAVLMKTQANLVSAVSKRVNDLHSYECPCVIALPITDGNPAFLSWIVDETAADQED